MHLFNPHQKKKTTLVFYSLICTSPRTMNYTFINTNLDSIIPHTEKIEEKIYNLQYSIFMILIDTTINIQ